MRIEETTNLCDLVEWSIRQQIPAAEVQSVIDNIGLPYSVDQNARLSPIDRKAI